MYPDEDSFCADAEAKANAIAFNRLQSDLRRMVWEGHGGRGYDAILPPPALPGIDGGPLAAALDAVHGARRQIRFVPDA